MVTGFRFDGTQPPSGSGATVGYVELYVGYDATGAEAQRNYESARFPFREGQIGQMDGRWIE
eukprot:scaffold359975_cov35-Attheya_sp.AAC.1